MLETAVWHLNILLLILTGKVNLATKKLFLLYLMFPVVNGASRRNSISCYRSVDTGY